MRKLLVGAIIALQCLVAPPVWAAKGEVLDMCKGHYVVLTTMGYALLEWYGGDTPEKGDTIVGDFESYGMKELYNLRSDNEVKFWVEEYWLSRDQAIKKFANKCN